MSVFGELFNDLTGWLTVGIILFMLVMMADQIRVSVGDLFMGAVFPGLLLVGLFMAWSLYSTWKSGNR